ncbi:ribosome maturation factor RimM [Nocardioides daphniae]|uniref:ribosome maturation factor RimM n=1 Tax=Nocardioides daphniae TaxID=402297 RepID=UPI0023B0A586|nr:ribosome maturation factor RimM [Nocardioides daphniae]
MLSVRAPKGSAAPWPSLTVRSARWHQSVLLLGFEEWTDRNTAETARGILLEVTLTESDVPEDPDEFYEHQVVGLVVRNLEGVEIGTVTGLVQGAAQDLLQVKAADGRPTLVPFVQALVPEVDVAGGFVVVADRPGLVSPFPDDGPEGSAEQG